MKKPEGEKVGKDQRPYAAIAASIEHRALADRQAAMQTVVDALWDGLQASGVSWVGFYTKDPAAEQLIVGPRRDKPACSPIGLHGVCGRAWRERRAFVVD